MSLQAIGKCRAIVFNNLTKLHLNKVRIVQYKKTCNIPLSIRISCQIPAADNKVRFEKRNDWIGAQEFIAKFIA